MNNFLLKAHFQNPYFFKVKNTFEPYVFKKGIKKFNISLNHFALLIINVKIFSNFQKEWCICGRKKGRFKKKKGYPFSRFQCFKYAPKKIDLCQALNM